MHHDGQERTIRRLRDGITELVRKPYRIWPRRWRLTPTPIRPLIWRLHRDGEAARAVIVPHALQTTLVWWINDQINGAEDFPEWSGALERADAVRARLLTDDWLDVS